MIVSELLSPAMKLQGSYDHLGYRAATLDRETGRAATGGSGDYHLRQDRELLGRIAQRFDRDNGIYEGILSRFCDAVLGPDGFTLHPETGNDRLDAKISGDWSEFAEAPEVRGSFDWLECQRIALRGIANDGDSSAIITNREQFRFVEAEEIVAPSKLAPALKGKGRGNLIDQGVELDPLGAPVAYYLAPRTPYGTVQPSRAKRIAARDAANEPIFVFAANRKRFSQTRGVPVMTSSFANVHRLNDTIDSEAIAWQTLAKFAVAIEREKSAELAFGESKLDKRAKASGGDADLTKRFAEVEAAIMFFANPGEKITPIARNLPGRDFPESVRMFLRLIGLPLGIPLEVILLDYSKSNYTSSRAALEQAFRMFVAWQRWLKRKWYTPLYRGWLRWKIAAGRYPDRPQVRKHSWGSPEFPWVDHLKEAQAWGQRLDRGLATQTMALKSINLDFKAYIEKRGSELEAAIKAAKAIEAKYPGVIVPYQLLAGIPASKQASAPQDPPAGGEQGTEGDDADETKPDQAADPADDSTDDKDDDEPQEDAS